MDKEAGIMKGCPSVIVDEVDVEVWSLEEVVGAKSKRFKISLLPNSTAAVVATWEVEDDSGFQKKGK